MEKEVISTLSSAGAEFKTTSWGLVLAAGQHDAPGGSDALSRLYRAYWYPLYAFVRRQGHDACEAEDLTQEFFAQLMVRHDLVAVRPENGRFRSYLLAGLKHFLANQWHRSQAQKRGGGQRFVSWDDESPETRYRSEPIDSVTPETLYERRWALTVLQRVVDRLRAEYATTGKGDLFEALKTFLSAPKSTPHHEIAAQYGISVSAVGVAIHRLRHRYGELLREEIAQTLSQPQEIDEEIRHLIAVLAESGLSSCQDS